MQTKSRTSGRRWRVLEGLALHDMAPVAGAVADGEEDRDPAAACSAKASGPQGNHSTGLFACWSRYEAGLAGEAVGAPVGGGRGRCTEDIGGSAGRKGKNRVEGEGSARSALLRETGGGGWACLWGCGPTLPLTCLTHPASGGVPMPRVCHFTGRRRPSAARVYRGQKIVKGGFGLKPTGITRRTFAEYPDGDRAGRRARSGSRFPPRRSAPGWS